MHWMSVFIIFSLSIIVKVNSDYLLGEYADMKDFPYHVNLLVNDKPVCSGAIVTEHSVVTAAQCVHNLKPSGLSVKAGSNKLKKGGKKLRVTDIIVHGNYTPGTDKKFPRNDIALLVVKSGIKFTRTINMTKMADTDETPKFKMANISSWRSGSLIHVDLRYKEIPQANIKKCNGTYKKRIVEAQFCAGFENDALTTCNNEPGSPLVANKVLIGLLSVSAICKRKIKPEVFTDMGYYHEWVEQQMNDVPKDAIDNSDSDKTDSKDDDQNDSSKNGDKNKSGDSDGKDDAQNDSDKNKSGASNSKDDAQNDSDKNKDKNKNKSGASDTKDGAQNGDKNKSGASNSKDGAQNDSSKNGDNNKLRSSDTTNSKPASKPNTSSSSNQKPAPKPMARTTAKPKKPTTPKKPTKRSRSSIFEMIKNEATG